MKITFSRIITVIVCFEMTALLPVSWVVQSWPPKWFMICWLIFWLGVEICNVTMKKRKHNREDEQSFINGSIDLLKDKNINNKDIVDFIRAIKEIKE